jgi:hypothetical protein
MSVLCPAASFSDAYPPALLPHAPVFASNGHNLDSGLEGWTIRVRMPLVVRGFSPLQILHIRPGAHPASYTMGTGVLRQGQGAQGSNTDDPPPPSTKGKFSSMRS